MLSNYTLASAGYSDGMFVEDLLNNLAALVGLPLVIPVDYTFSEARGATYGLKAGNTDRLRITLQDPSQNALSWLKKLSLALGFVPYSQQSSFYFLKRTGRPIASLNLSAALAIEKLFDRQYKEFVEVKATKNWQQGLTNPPPALPGALVHSHSIGSQRPNATRNYSVDATGILDAVYVPTPATGNEYAPKTAADPDSLCGTTCIQYTDRPPASSGRAVCRHFAPDGNGTVSSDDQPGKHGLERARPTA